MPERRNLVASEELTVKALKFVGHTVRRQCAQDSAHGGDKKKAILYGIFPQTKGLLLAGRGMGIHVQHILQH